MLKHSCPVLLKGLKAHVFSQRFSHYLSDSTVTRKKKNIYKKYLRHLIQELLKSSQVRKFESRERDYRREERTNMKSGTPGQRLEEKEKWE